MKFLNRKRHTFKSKKMVIISAIMSAGILLSACSQVLSPQIDASANQSKNLATNFDLTNLNQKDLLQTVMVNNLNTTNPKLVDATAHRLIYNWSQKFLADKQVDPGSVLYQTQTALKDQMKKAQETFDESLKNAESRQTSEQPWQKIFQNQLDPVGGTKEGWLINNFSSQITTDFIEAIFHKLYLSYEENENFTETVAETTLNDPQNWKNIKFMPSGEELQIGNQAYQKMFANFQAFVFDQWVKNERPFIVWDASWKYANSSINSMNNIYNSTDLANNDVTLPNAANYNFPAFNMGDNNSSGDLNSYNNWQTGVKSNNLISKTTGGIDLKSVFNTNNETNNWTIYDNQSLANEKDGYLSSAIIHGYQKLFQSNTTAINKLDLSGSNDWSNNQKSDPLELFLITKETSTTHESSDADNKNSQVGIAINNKVLFNQANKKFATKNFVYPLRDVVSPDLDTGDQAKPQSLWTLAKTETGMSAVTIDGGYLISKAASFDDKIKALKNNLLWRQALYYFNAKKTNNNINIDLLSQLKNYTKAHFSNLIVKYAELQKTNPTQLENLTNKDFLFDDKQNFLLSDNNATFLDLLSQIEKYQNVVQYQKNLILLRNSLSSTVSKLSGKQFVKVEDKTYAPYDNGLATPLAFKRNLNITTNDPIYQPNSTETQTFSNDGDYPEISKFFLEKTINVNADLYGLKAINDAYQAFKTKMSAWLATLEPSNEGIYWNKNLYYLNSLEFNYTYAAILSNKDAFSQSIENAYLANHINYLYSQNKINFNLSNYELKNYFSSETEDTIKKAIETAVQQTIYSSIYTGSVGNINNGKDFIGGYKIEDSSVDNYNAKNIQSYLDKVTSYWNQAFYYFNNIGNDLTAQINSQYIKTLFATDWLLKNNLNNLLTFLQTQIQFGNYGAIVWAQEVNLNNNDKAGLAETDSHKNDKLKNYSDFNFVANPNNVLTSPYFSYNLSAPTTNPLKNDSVQNYISAKAPIQIKTTDSSVNEKFENLSGFYGLVLKDKGYPTALPAPVGDAVFTAFNKANPDGNLSAFASANPTEKAPALGRLFGLVIKNNDGTSNIEATTNYIETQIKQVKTFSGFNGIANQLIGLLPDLANDINAVMNNNSFKQLEQAKDEDNNLIPNKWVESNSLPVLNISLQQKVQALLNILNGQKYLIDTSVDNKTLLADFHKMYDTVYEKKPDYQLIKKNDLDRFVGALQNPQQNQSIFPDQKYFIPNAEASRIGYVTYALQINYNDVSSLDNFKIFMSQLGMDAFLKTILNLAQSPQVQREAISDFILSKDFNQLEVNDARLVDILGKNWAILKN